MCINHESTSSTQLTEHMRVDGVNRWMVGCFCGSGVEKQQPKTKQNNNNNNNNKNVCRNHRDTCSTQLREHGRVDGVNRWMVGCFCGSGVEKQQPKTKQNNHSNNNKNVCRNHGDTSSTQLREHVRVDGVNKWMVGCFRGSGVGKKKRKKKTCKNYGDTSSTQLREHGRVDGVNGRMIGCFRGSGVEKNKNK